MCNICPEKYDACTMKILISFIALVVACLVWVSVAVNYVLAKLVESRPHLVPQPTFFAAYRHIKACLTGEPFDYGAMWIRKSRTPRALR